MRSVSRGFAVFLAIVTLLGVGTLSVVGSGTAHAASLSTSYQATRGHVQFVGTVGDAE